MNNTSPQTPTITIDELLARSPTDRLQMLQDLQEGRPTPRVVVHIPVLRRSLRPGGPDQAG